MFRYKKQNYFVLPLLKKTYMNHTILKRYSREKKNLTRYLKKKKRKIFNAKYFSCIKYYIVLNLYMQDDCICVLQSSYEGVVDMKKIVLHTENSPNLVRSIAFGRRWRQNVCSLSNYGNIQYKIFRNKNDYLLTVSN